MVLMKVFTSCKVSLSKQFFIIGTFSSSDMSYVFIWSMLVTSISKLSNFTYLSWASQLNEGFSQASPPCLCFCVSLRLTVFIAANLGPTSASPKCHHDCCCCLVHCLVGQWWHSIGICHFSFYLYFSVFIVLVYLFQSDCLPI